MMRVGGKSMSKSRTELSNATNYRLKLYSAAAIAAAVGALAMVQPAEGEVVITRKTIPIPPSSYFGTSNPVYISLNNNGVNDFSFYLYSFAYHSRRELLWVTPLQGGAVDSNGGGYATELARGAKIGASAQFGGSNNFTRIEGERRWGGLSSSSKTYIDIYGPWGGNKANTYLGVKFLINGETHYGWVRLTVGSGPGGLAGTITAYAYETEANKRILTGVPEGEKPVIIDENKKPSLGALAAGADGLAKWRH
jgi:hypothetical protein